VQKTPAAHLVVTGVGLMVVVLFLDTSAPDAVACDVFCFLLDDDKGGGLPSFEGQSISVE
jgi:hypothetical protein